jgi:hypothetical protein
VEDGLLSQDEQDAFEPDWEFRFKDATAFLWLPPMVKMMARKVYMWSILLPNDR